MKKLIATLALICLCSPTQATVFTMIASGNVNAGTTYVGGVAPDCTGAISQDQVIVPNGMTLTMNVNCTLGNYPTSDTGITVAALAPATTAGTGIVNWSSPVTFTFRGPIYQGPATWSAGSGVTFTHDSSAASGTPSYKWHVQAVNCTTSPCALLQVTGTSGSRDTFNIASASGNFGGFGDGTYQDSGQVQIAYTDFTSCGTSTVPCDNTYSFVSVPLSTSFTHDTFTSSGVIQLGETYKAGTHFVFNNNKVVTPLNSSGYGLNLGIYGGDSTLVVQAEQNYIEGQTYEAFLDSAYDGTDDLAIVTGNVFAGLATTPPYKGGTVGHAAGHFDHNIFYQQGSDTSGESICPSVSVTNLTILEAYNNSSGATHLYGCGPTYSTVFNAGITEKQYNDEAGKEGSSNTFYATGQSSTVGVVTYTAENWIITPTPNHSSGGQLFAFPSSTCNGTSIICPVITVNNNTLIAIPVATGGFAAAANGESNPGWAGLYPTVDNNLFWCPASINAYGVGWFANITLTNGTFGTVGYNAWEPNCTGTPYTTGRYGDASNAYNVTPGTGDVSLSAPAGFVGCKVSSVTSIYNCDLNGFATTQGITYSTWADIIAQFKCMNDASGCLLSTASVAAYFAFVRAGYAPTNSQVHNAGYPSGDIGAIPYQATGNPFWAFPTP